MDYRLKKSGDFDKVFSKGKKCYANSLMMIYLPSGRLKIGYSVSKKHGNAVVRNRIKRLLRAAVRQVKDSLHGNYYIVFLPKVKEEYSYNEYLADITRLLAKEKLTDDK